MKRKPEDDLERDEKKARILSVPPDLDNESDIIRNVIEYHFNHQDMFHFVWRSMPRPAFEELHRELSTYFSLTENHGIRAYHKIHRLLLLPQHKTQLQHFVLNFKDLFENYAKQKMNAYNERRTTYLQLIQSGLLFLKNMIGCKIEYYSYERKFYPESEELEGILKDVLDQSILVEIRGQTLEFSAFNPCGFWECNKSRDSDLSGWGKNPKLWNDHDFVSLDYLYKLAFSTYVSSKANGIRVVFERSPLRDHQNMILLDYALDAIQQSGLYPDFQTHLPAPTINVNSWRDECSFQYDGTLMSVWELAHGIRLESLILNSSLCLSVVQIVVAYVDYVEMRWDHKQEHDQRPYFNKRKLFFVE